MKNRLLWLILLEFIINRASLMARPITLTSKIQACAKGKELDCIDITDQLGQSTIRKCTCI